MNTLIALLALVVRVYCGQLTSYFSLTWRVKENLIKILPVKLTKKKYPFVHEYATHVITY